MLTKVLGTRWILAGEKVYAEEELLEISGPNGGRVQVKVRTGRVATELKMEEMFGEKTSADHQIDRGIVRDPIRRKSPGRPRKNRAVGVGESGLDQGKLGDTEGLHQAEGK